MRVDARAPCRRWRGSRGRPPGRSLTCMPSALVLPMTWPPLIPPPASTVVQALGKWSRPALALILGVRPNSPIQTIRVESSSPRAAQVVHQRRPGRVEHVAELLDRLEVLLVRVPAERLLRPRPPRASPRRTARPARPAGAPAGSPGRTGCGRRRRGAAAGSSSRSNALAAADRISRTARRRRPGGSSGAIAGVARRGSRCRNASSRPSRASARGVSTPGGELEVLDLERPVRIGGPGCGPIAPRSPTTSGAYCGPRKPGPNAAGLNAPERARC